VTAPEELIVEYMPAWDSEFAALGRDLRHALGSVAPRIDHVGSTSVPGLAAKPIVDMQVSVPSLEPVDDYRAAIESCGFEWQPDNPELTKRFFREVSPRKRTHLHVRQCGSFGEQFALLFRDCLRAHREHADAYASLKRSVAHLLLTDRSAYVEAKVPFIWDGIRDADAWAQETGWAPREQRRVMDADLPYELTERPGDGARSIVEIPVAWALDDWEQFAFVPDFFGPGVIEDPDKALALWTGELTEAHRHGSCFTLTIHPFLSGRLGRLRALETLIETMAELSGLWLATGREIAEHVRSLGLTPRVFPQPEIPT
jgi:GrpB-like predicted nucleotidyltransferase (UPF0157 family)